MRLGRRARRSPAGRSASTATGEPTSVVVAMRAGEPPPRVAAPCDRALRLLVRCDDGAVAGDTLLVRGWGVAFTVPRSGTAVVELPPRPPGEYPVEGADGRRHGVLVLGRDRAGG